jgi:gentisate 1,2-dioxygenase
MATETFLKKPALTPERAEFYARLGERSTAPLWEVLGKLVSPQPNPETAPVLWRYDTLRPLLMEAGRLLTAEEAERRVLVLENPGLKARSQATGSLFAGLQMILPGEVARCHRHVASALRLIIEGRGAYTSVEGERVEMAPGDFILTPSWTYHDHGNTGDEPVVWLDGLDLPMVNLFDASFAGHPGPLTQPSRTDSGAARARYGANMLPVDYTAASLSSPLFAYPYARSREVLDVMHRTGQVHPCHGIKTRFVNPVTGGYPMPTIAAFMQLLPAGFHGGPYRATDATVYAVIEGRGHTTVAETRYEWGPRDMFVIPSWVPVFHEAEGESVLFSMSDRAAQQALGLWREEAPIRS